MNRAEKYWEPYPTRNLVPDSKDAFGNTGPIFENHKLSKRGRIKKNTV